jgi:signal transduction histidine kinase
MVDLPQVAERRTRTVTIDHKGRIPGSGPVRAGGGELPIELEIARIRAQAAEATLERSEIFLAAAQRLSSSGSFSWRVSTGEITCSEQFRRIFEFAQGSPVTLELMGSRVHTEDIPSFNDLIERARAAAGDFEFQHRLTMPDHSVKYLHLHLVTHATRDQQGQQEYIGTVQDVTQRRLSEQAFCNVLSELAHVARIMSLGTLAASIAHEVNQPLSGIITNASTCLRLLAADPPDVDGACETARRTLRDGNRASDVIKRLRALFAKKAVTSEAVDLNEAAREAIALSLCDLQRRRVVLRAELVEKLPVVMGDRVQLQQVILNLLLNAADAMSGIEDRPRQMLIRTEREGGDAVRLSVRDTGVGVGPQGAKLFEPFYTTKSDGMGIGLSISRLIIENHHGRLWAAPNDGPGATFSFSVPCEPQVVSAGAAVARSFGSIRVPGVTHAMELHMSSL